MKKKSEQKREAKIILCMHVYWHPNAWHNDQVVLLSSAKLFLFIFEAKGLNQIICIKRRCKTCCCLNIQQLFEISAFMIYLFDVHKIHFLQTWVIYFYSTLYIMMVIEERTSIFCYIACYRDLFLCMEVTYIYYKQLCNY